jgi:hypothetical protein
VSGDRVILAVKYTPAAGASQVRKAVGGFLRYVQYRDKHPDSELTSSTRVQVGGLLKYVAYRDRATPAGRLFGPDGIVGDPERSDFATYVSKSVAATRPTKERGGAGGDRRRAVYRFVISPERAAGLDLAQLTRAAISRLERESGASGLRWVAAEHRNTAHPHVHLILAGIRETSPGTCRGFLLTPRRLAAMKEELALEIGRQRDSSRADTEAGRARAWLPHQPASRHDQSGRLPRSRWSSGARPPAHINLLALRRWRPTVLSRLQAAAIRYRRRMEREAEAEAARQEREWSR